MSASTAYESLKSTARELVVRTDKVLGCASFRNLLLFLLVGSIAIIANSAKDMAQSFRTMARTAEINQLFMLQSMEPMMMHAPSSATAAADLAHRLASATQAQVAQ
jgi:hypothetical protein